jgi:hypothetical protein
MQLGIDLSTKTQAKEQVIIGVRNERQRRDNSVPTVGAFAYYC